MANAAINAADRRFETENGHGADLAGAGIRAHAAGKRCEIAERAVASLLVLGSIRTKTGRGPGRRFKRTVACSRPRAGTRVDLVVARDDGGVCTCCIARPVAGDFEIGDRVRARGMLNQATNRIGEASVQAVAPNMQVGPAPRLQQPHRGVN